MAQQVALAPDGPVGGDGNDSVDGHDVNGYRLAILKAGALSRCH